MVREPCPDLAETPSASGGGAVHEQSWHRDSNKATEHPLALCNLSLVRLSSPRAQHSLHSPAGRSTFESMENPECWNAKATPAPPPESDALANGQVWLLDACDPGSHCFSLVPESVESKRAVFKASLHGRL
jgi:hypothetical protein